MLKENYDSIKKHFKGLDSELTSSKISLKKPKLLQKSPEYLNNLLSEQIENLLLENKPARNPKTGTSPSKVVISRDYSTNTSPERFSIRREFPTVKSPTKIIKNDSKTYSPCKIQSKDKISGYDSPSITKYCLKDKKNPTKSPLEESTIIEQPLASLQISNASNLSKSDYFKNNEKKEEDPEKNFDMNQDKQPLIKVMNTFIAKINNDTKQNLQHISDYTAKYPEIQNFIIAPRQNSNLTKFSDFCSKTQSLPSRSPEPKEYNQSPFNAMKSKLT